MTMLVDLALIALLLSASSGHVVIRRTPPNKTEAIPISEHQLSKQTADPTDFGWIQRWAAVGDSFTAGIGSGSALGSRGVNRDDWECSRYDQSYPMVINRAFGPAVSDFQFSACSGDRSGQIYERVGNLDGNLNLVMMTAGGNDLCMVSTPSLIAKQYPCRQADATGENQAAMIMKCVFLPFYKDSDCQTVIDKAQSNIDTILKPNLKQVLQALNSKMAKDSVVVYNGYAQFFNTDSEKCATDENWTMPHWWPFSSALPLTVDRRKRFNSLVIGINNAIKSVVTDISNDPSIKYKIGFSDWDPWPYNGVSGQMCDPASKGTYPDDAQPDLQFFKPDTQLPPERTELKKRDPELYELHRRAFEAARAHAKSENIYDSILWHSVNPRAVALRKLDRRAPVPPDCPGDGNFDWTFGLGLPDSTGKNFHPNEQGHVTIASFAIETMIDLRAKVLGIDAPTCKRQDAFTCYQTQGKKAYASGDRMNLDYKDFCNNFVKQPEHTVGWHADHTYNKDTPDEYTIKIQLSDKVADFNKDECLDSFNRIVNGCDGNDPGNPMDWKFGGEYVRGEYTYTITPWDDSRPWPPVQRAIGSCKGWYHGSHSSYEIYGSGFSTWDYGQKTLLPSIKGCLGLGVTAWKFDYIKPPTSEGIEWKATFTTPVYVRARCFKNNKVVMAAGGFTNGCGGNDP